MIRRTRQNTYITASIQRSLYGYNMSMRTKKKKKTFIHVGDGWYLKTFGEIKNIENIYPHWEEQHSLKPPKQSLADAHPEIAAQWDYARNGCVLYKGKWYGGKKPEDVAPGTHFQYWFLCPNGHSYHASVHNRTGVNKTGCPLCQMSKPEQVYEKLLRDLNIEYVYNRAVLISGKTLFFDFWLPELNMFIEIDGEHHFEPVNFGSDRRTPEQRFAQQKVCDELKNKHCKLHNITLKRIHASLLVKK